MVPAGCMITGALIKIPTILVISGDVIAYIGEETVELSGYNVIQAYAHRKQAFVAVTDTFLTMVFPTSATDIESAESEFTDETEKLITRKESESL